MALTAKQQRLVQYNDIITRNKKLFKPGCTLSRKDFVALFAIQNIQTKGAYAKVHRSNLKLVQVQMEINMLMRENGLYLKSNDYYSSFSVAEKKQAKNTIIRYSAEVDINNYCTTRLENKLKERVTAGTWGTYKKVASGIIANMSHNYKTLRHSATINRVKNY